MSKKNFSGGCVKKASPVFIAGEILCRFGKVQVQICRPFGKKFLPFPTSFWLTCPYLIKRAGTLESSGGVRELENYIISHNLIHEWRRYNIFHQQIRIKLAGKNTASFMRKYHRKIFHDTMRGGIGGIKIGEGVNVKCLHLQTASFIALGHHPAGDWLKSKGLCGDCESALNIV